MGVRAVAAPTRSAALCAIVGAAALFAGCSSAGGYTAASASQAESTAASTGAHQPGHRHAGHRRRPSATGVAGIPAADLPNRALTPGSVLTRAAARVCTSGYAASVRDVPESEKDAVYARYHIPHLPYRHEIDHLIPLELGGSNAMVNLWPEPYAGRWGARAKDALEDRLHQLVCAGRLALAAAQHADATNWVMAYERYLGSPPAATAVPRAGERTGATHATSGACEPGYSPCLPVVRDLNCDQISDAKKPIRVTGADPYHLDGDGDGLGCE
jgi:hypothetical protein